MGLTLPTSDSLQVAVVQNHDDPISAEAYVQLHSCGSLVQRTIECLERVFGGCTVSSSMTDDEWGGVRLAAPDRD
jgi:hypothetical protein